MFIAIHPNDSDEVRLLNVDFVEQVLPDPNGSRLCFGNDGECLSVTETLEELSEVIQAAHPRPN